MDQKSTLPKNIFVNYQILRYKLIMLLKLGVDISRLKPPLRKKLDLIDSIFAKYFSEAVITSTYEGDHSPGSLHYANLAVDLRNPLRDKKSIVDDLTDRLGLDYDVVIETDHIHVEYDPKTKRGLINEK